MYIREKHVRAVMRKGSHGMVTDMLQETEIRKINIANTVIYENEISTRAYVQ
jgi:hypothetical protein